MRILGEDVSDPKRALAVKQRIGVVPENLALFDNLTAREYLTFIGRMYLLPRDTVRARADELLAMMDLAHEEKKLTLEFSHGMKKKLSLAAALIPNPDLLFLDEPFEGVDAVASRVLRDTLKQCVGRGATVFLTSHVLEIVEKLCTDVGIIAQGKAGASGHDGGIAARRLLAGGQIHLGRRQRRTRGAKIKLAGMNREQLKTILWLRWRLMCNQWRRSGGLGAVISMLVGVGAIMLGALSFAGRIARGDFRPGQGSLAANHHVRLAGRHRVFLFFWMIGLLTELQRSETIDLQKLMHLPVALGQMFGINYLVSHFRLEHRLRRSRHARTGHRPGIARGPEMILLLPLALSMVLMITAWTYCLRGWLATMMTNPRRRRTMIMCITFGFILFSQGPNLYFQCVFKPPTGKPLPARGERTLAAPERNIQPFSRRAKFHSAAVGARRRARRWLKKIRCPRCSECSAVRHWRAWTCAAPIAARSGFITAKPADKRR